MPTLKLRRPDLPVLFGGLAERLGNMEQTGMAQVPQGLARRAQELFLLVLGR